VICISVSGCLFKNVLSIVTVSVIIIIIIIILTAERIIIIIIIITLQSQLTIRFETGNNATK
jgi:hypothetical protein